MANRRGVRGIKHFGTGRYWESIQRLFKILIPVRVQKSYSMPIGLDFQRRYATKVLDLEQLNKDLNKVLHEVQQFCYEVSEKRGSIGNANLVSILFVLVPTVNASI